MLFCPLVAGTSVQNGPLLTILYQNRDGVKVQSVCIDTCTHTHTHMEDQLMCEDFRPHVAHLKWPQSDVYVSVNAIRLEHCLNGTGGEREHGFLVLEEESPVCTLEQTHQKYTKTDRHSDVSLCGCLRQMAL